MQYAISEFKDVFVAHLLEYQTYLQRKGDFQTLMGICAAIERFVEGYLFKRGDLPVLITRSDDGGSAKGPITYNDAYRAVKSICGGQRA